MIEGARGIITVSEAGISVKMHNLNESTCSGYSEVTVESLQDAIRMLASWMDIGYEDIAKECQRVHDNDQQRAYLRDCVTHIMQQRKND